ncbi:MAG: GNAT family N-acetyltransferase [Candidatus Kapabacteria bacterium]|nr:GNAT family N-acetyltransferase [Candidatus Kapabacteria bacterium]
MQSIEYLNAFHPDFWGNGYAKEIGKAYLSSFAEHHRSLCSLIALIYPDNVRSIHVVDALGFTHCGQKEVFGSSLHYYEKSWYVHYFSHELVLLTLYICAIEFTNDDVYDI